jgi:hypothetical protein
MRKRRVARGVGGAAIVGVAVVLAYALWWRKNPSACPYGLRLFIELPHPIITRERLRDAPRPGR